jgi:hypothetical protein
MTSYELNAQQAAAVLDVDAKTLRKHYAAEIILGAQRAQAERVSRSLLAAIKPKRKKAVTNRETAGVAPPSSSAAVP